MPLPIAPGLPLCWKRGEAAEADQKSTMSTANDPREFQGDATAFVEAVFADIELAFSRQFGNRWTSETQQLFQEAMRSCREIAKKVDGATVAAQLPIQHQRVLTMFPDGRG